MFDHSYDELFRAADILWPGEAGAILDNPTDEQLALILGVLTPSPVQGFVQVRDVLPDQATL